MTTARTIAIASLRPGPVDQGDSFVEIEIDVPAPGPTTCSSTSEPCR